eukprot:870768-Rhodomonas_salina.3
MRDSEASPAPAAMPGAPPRGRRPQVSRVVEGEDSEEEEEEEEEEVVEEVVEEERLGKPENEEVTVTVGERSLAARRTATRPRPADSEEESLSLRGDSESGPPAGVLNLKPEPRPARAEVRPGPAGR